MCVHEFVYMCLCAYVSVYVCICTCVHLCECMCVYEGAHCVASLQMPEDLGGQLVLSFHHQHHQDQILLSGLETSAFICQAILVSQKGYSVQHDIAQATVCGGLHSFSLSLLLVHSLLTCRCHRCVLCLIILYLFYNIYVRYIIYYIYMFYNY